MRAAQPDPTRRTPGQHARQTVQRLRLRTLLALGALAVPTALLGRAFGVHDPRELGAMVLLLIAILAISRYVLPVVERRDRGAAGEELVGRLLDQLGREGWRVIHDASFGHGNVDHILIGPPGVFAIETKSHPGPIRVARLHGALLAQARAESEALRRESGVAAEPVIVYSRAWVDRPGSKRRGVRVIPARTLLGYMRNRPERMSAPEIASAHANIAQALTARREHSGRLVRARRLRGARGRPAADMVRPR